MEQKNVVKDKRAAIGQLLQYLVPYKSWVALGILGNVGIGLIMLVPALLYGRITDKVILNLKAPVDVRLWTLGYCAAGLVLVYALSSVFVLIRSYVMHVLGEKIILDLRKETYGKLQTLSVSFYDSRQTGEIMSRVTNDSEVVEEFVNHAADTLISDTVRLIAMCVIMFVMSGVLAAAALLPVPLLFFLAYRFARRVRPIYRKVRERLADINAKVQENLSGMRVIKAFAREEHEYSNFCREAEGFFTERVKAIRLWTTFSPSVEFLTRVGQVSVWVVGPFLIINGHSTMGMLVIFNNYLGMLYEPIRRLAQINDTIQRSLAAAERIFEIINQEPEIENVSDAAAMPSIQGRVEFDHVCFSYQDGEEVLKDICIKAEPGQIVALVGRSGAGKTSIVNLIPRFYDPDSGRVLVDGLDVKHVTQESLRRQVAMVLQDTFLFSGTVRENIRYGKLDATDDEIVEAAKAANAHEFIEVMSSGYETEIGERGVKLSGGQKQRLAIARAILADPRILILDEATSSVDSESEYLIHRAMDRLMEGRTSFVIAHRLSTIKHADQIITLEHGRVSEIGDHNSLVVQNGTYAQMYSMQFRLDEEVS